MTDVAILYLHESGREIALAIRERLRRKMYDAQIFPPSMPTPDALGVARTLFLVEPRTGVRLSQELEKVITQLLENDHMIVPVTRSRRLDIPADSQLLRTLGSLQWIVYSIDDPNAMLDQAVTYAKRHPSSQLRRTFRLLLPYASICTVFLIPMLAVLSQWKIELQKISKMKRDNSELIISHSEKDGEIERLKTLIAKPNEE